jgi:hypothetical protein
MSLYARHPGEKSPLRSLTDLPGAALADTAIQLGKKAHPYTYQTATALINSANPTRLSTRRRL